MNTSEWRLKGFFYKTESLFDSFLFLQLTALFLLGKKDKNHCAQKTQVYRERSIAAVKRTLDSCEKMVCSPESNLACFCVKSQ